MNDEQILLDDLNSFEDFMENADVTEIAKEHGLTMIDTSSKVEIVESAEQIHNRICDNFSIVEKTLYEICVDLKNIRDNKHYKTLGYDTFEQYCLENFNLNRRTVYRYISVAENLSNDFVTSMSQNGVGVTKLDILSRLTDEERTKLVQTIDIEKTTVKELEQESKQMKENRKKDISDANNDNTIFPSEQIKLSELQTLFNCLDELKSHLVLEVCNDVTYYDTEYLTTTMLGKMKASIIKMQDMIRIFNTILSMKGMGE